MQEEANQRMLAAQEEEALARRLFQRLAEAFAALKRAAYYTVLGPWLPVPRRRCPNPGNGQPSPCPHAHLCSLLCPWLPAPRHRPFIPHALHPSCPPLW